MTKYLSGVLTVIALGVVAIAYGLLTPRAAANGAATLAPIQQFQEKAAPVAADARASRTPVAQNVPAEPYLVYARPAAPAYAQPVNEQYETFEANDPPMASRPAPRVVRTVQRTTASSSSADVYVERAPRRDWKRTAMIIGGSTATGAGVGAIFGGKKGALIGAAIAGGVTTVRQTAK